MATGRDRLKDWWLVITQNPAPTTAILAAIVSIVTLAGNVTVNLFIAQEAFKHNIALEIMKRPGQICDVYERLTFLLTAKLLDDEVSEGKKPIANAIPADSKCPPPKSN